MSQDSPQIPFVIEISADVRDFVLAQQRADAAFEWRWRAVLELLEVAGHQIGQPVAGGPVGQFHHFRLADWGVKVVWQFSNNTVRIRAARLA